MDGFGDSLLNSLLSESCGNFQSTKVLSNKKCLLFTAWMAANRGKKKMQVNRHSCTDEE